MAYLKTNDGKEYSINKNIKVINGFICIDGKKVNQSSDFKPLELDKNILNNN